MDPLPFVMVLVPCQQISDPMAKNSLSCAIPRVTVLALPYMGDSARIGGACKYSSTGSNTLWELTCANYRDSGFVLLAGLGVSL